MPFSTVQIYIFTIKLILYFQNISCCWVCVLFTYVSQIRVRIRLGSLGLLSRRLTHRDLSSCSTSLQPSVSIVVPLKLSVHSLRKWRHHLYALFFIQVHRGLRCRLSLLELLVFMSLLAVLGTFPRVMFDLSKLSFCSAGSRCQRRE